MLTPTQITLPSLGRGGLSADAAPRSPGDADNCPRLRGPVASAPSTASQAAPNGTRLRAPLQLKLYLTDLDHRLNVAVIWNVAHQSRRMRRHGRLKISHRLE
jgi:hypothetical protein